MKQINRAMSTLLITSMLIFNVLIVAIPLFAFIFFGFAIANNSLIACKWIIECRLLLDVWCFLSLFIGAAVTDIIYKKAEDR